MITQKQAQRIASEYCRENNGNAFEFHAVVYGIEVAITLLQPEINQLREALQNLLDEQNGAPLERRRQQWQSAVDAAQKMLK